MTPPITVEKLPRVAELRARRQRSTRDALREILLTGDLDPFWEVVEPLAEEFDPAKVALAAVKLAHDASGTALEMEELPEVELPSAEDDRRGRKAAGRDEGRARTAARGTTRLFVGVGRSAGIRPRVWSASSSASHVYCPTRRWPSLSYSPSAGTRCPVGQKRGGHWRALLRQVVARPDVPVSHLHMLPAAERRSLASWSGAESPTTGTRQPAVTVHELVSAAAAVHPDEVAVVSGADRLTYRELDARADALAGHLRGLGVGPESSRTPQPPTAFRPGSGRCST
jgi:hypothetical protein